MDVNGCEWEPLVGNLSRLNLALFAVVVWVMLSQYLQVFYSIFIPQEVGAFKYGFFGAPESLKLKTRILTLQPQTFSLKASETTQSTMREIAPLRILALRAVGPPGCQPEITFGGAPNNTRPKQHQDSNGDINTNSDTKNNDNNNEDSDSNTNFSPPPPPEEPTITSRLLRSLRNSTMPIQPYVAGTTRANASDVDISQPWVMAVYPPRYNNDKNSPMEETTEFLTIENGNLAVECLQLLIDALVESGRAGDSRLGVHFFREWVHAVTGGMDSFSTSTTLEQQQQRPKKKQKKGSSSKGGSQFDHLPLGSLSLHNLASASIQTFRSMEYANVGSCLGTLDLTGTHGLTDSVLINVICSGSFPRIQRLSLKNSRKLTGKSIACLVKLRDLKALDVGGCFNVHPNDVIEMVQQHPGTKKGTLTEIYAGGLGWTDVALEELLNITSKHLKGLGVGFSTYLSGPGLILILSKAAGTLDRLSIPFCNGVDDTVTSALGKALPKLAVLDIRGCNKVYSLTGMMDGRIAASNSGAEVARHLFVLARYSGISSNSLEETSRLYRNEQGEPVVNCVLDGGGTGEGVRR